MENRENVPEDRQLVKINDLSLEETQLAEHLYNSAGLGPVVDAGLKDYDEHLQIENKLISKVLGPRGSDIKGYGEAVAKRVARLSQAPNWFATVGRSAISVTSNIPVPVS